MSNVVRFPVAKPTAERLIWQCGGCGGFRFIVTLVGEVECDECEVILADVTAVSEHSDENA